MRGRCVRAERNSALHAARHWARLRRSRRFACYMTGEWRDKATRLCSAGRSPGKAGSLVVHVAIAHVAVLARSLCQWLDFESHVC